MASFAPLFPLEKQFQAKDGRNNTGGWLKVYLAATDDLADTYSDYVGTRNPERIVLDDNGRATVICDKSKAYRLEVYDISGALLWTEEPVYCSGTGGGGVAVTRVISTDGSIGVESSTEGSVTTYDLSMAPPDSDEFLEWIKCSEEDCGASWKPVYQDGTMETEPGQGIKVHGGHLYHFTCSFTVDPDGTGVNYDTFQVDMYCGSAIVESRSFDIDSSLTDEVLCEFSHDLVPTEDACVYFALTIPSTCGVKGEVQAHRVYSGINAVPDTCATKQWVQDTFTYNMSARIPYSALEYDASSQITAISGSSIGGTDTTAVSSIASAYAQSAVSGFSSWTGDMSSISSKADQSSLDNCCSAMSGYISSIQGDTGYISSVVSGITGEFTGYIPYAALSGDGVKITGISGSAIGGTDYSAGEYIDISGNTISVTGLQPVSGMSSYVEKSAFDDCCSAMSGAVSSLQVDVSSISSVVSGLTGQTGDYVEKSAISAQSSEWNEISSLSSYVEKSAISAQSSQWNEVSGLSGKLDNSASSLWYPMTGNPSGFLTEHQSLSGYVQVSAISAESSVWNSASSISAVIPWSALEGTGSTITAISGSAVGSTSEGKVYSGIDPVVVDNDADTISVKHSGLTVDGTMTAYQSGSDIVIGVKPGSFVEPSAMTAYQPSGDYAYNSSLAGYIPTSESSKYVTSLAGYATEEYVDSSVSGKQDASSMTAYQLSGDYAYNSSVSGKADSSSLTAYQEITGMTAYQPSGDYAYNSALSAYQPSGDYAYNSAVSGKADSSALTAYQEVTGMTAYQPAGDYQPSGDYAYNSSLSGYIPTSESASYQLTADMTAYQPSGDYIYASALGTGEI